MSSPNPQGGNSAIELHDARVLEISGNNDRVQVFLDVFVHHSQGSPGVDCGTCWLATAKMLLTHCLLTGSSGELPTEVADGTVVCGSIYYHNIVPIPLHYEGRIKVILLLEDGSKLLLNAERLDWTIDGTMQFVEEFP